MKPMADFTGVTAVGFIRTGLGTQGDSIPTHSRFDAPQVRGDHFEALLQVGKPVENTGWLSVATRDFESGDQQR